jgi:hypothetical protein
MNMKRLAAAAIFAGWLILATLAASTLTAWHTISLPAAIKAHVTRGDAAAAWRLVHYLSPECACSRAVASYLVKRGPLGNAGEDVVLLASGNPATDAAFAKPLTENGFRVELRTQADAASRDGVEGVPTLEIVAPGNRIVFRGGYRERGAAPGAYLDVALLSALMASKPLRALPIYGCATSQRLSSALDPLGLKSLHF